MLERFKKEFLYTNAPQFYGKTSARTFQHAVKKDITDNTYSIEKKTSWTPKQKEYLVEHYQTDGVKKCANALKKTENAVRYMTQKLGLTKKQARSNVWTLNEKEYLTQHYQFDGISD